MADVSVHRAVHDALERRGQADEVVVTESGERVRVTVVESHEIRHEEPPPEPPELTAWQERAGAQLLELIGELATVSYLEGRATANPQDPMWPLYRRAVEIVDEHQQVRARKEIRALLRSGQVSKYELLRAGVR